MPEREDLEIIIRAKNLAGPIVEAFNRQMEELAAKARQGIDIRVERGRLMQQFADQIRGAEGAKKALKDIQTAADNAGRKALISFQGATYGINLLGAGTLRLTGSLGIVAGAFTTLGSIALSVIQRIIGAIIRLAEAIIAQAVAALRRLTLALAAATAAATALVAVLFKLGFGEIEFARRQKTALAVMLGSREAAEDLYNWMERYAESLRVDPHPLIEAGRAMTAFGMDTKHWLPIAADLAAAVDEPLERMVELLSRVENESVLLQSLARIGIGRRRLQEVGVRFTPAGQIVDRAELMGALETIVRRDFPNMAQRLNRGLGHIWESIKARATRDAAAIVSGAYVILERAGNNLLASWDRLRESDVWQRIRNRAGDVLAWIIQQVDNLIQRIPELAARFADMLDRAPIEEFLTALRAVAVFLYERVARIVELVTDFISERFRLAGISAGGSFAAIAVIIAKVAAGIEAIIETVIENWTGLMNWMKTTAARTGALIQQVWSFAKTVGGAVLDIAARAFGVWAAQISYLIADIKLLATAISMIHPKNWNLEALNRKLDDVGATLDELRERARLTGALIVGGWRGLWDELGRRIEAGVDFEGEIINPLQLGRRVGDAVRAAVQGVNAEMERLLGQRVVLPPLEDVADPFADATRKGVIEGVKEGMREFVHEVWGGTAEMLRKAGLTGRYYERIGAPIVKGEQRFGAAGAPMVPALAAAAAGAGMNVTLNIQAAPDLARDLRSPAVQHELEIAIEDVLERVARRYKP